MPFDTSCCSGPSLRSLRLEALDRHFVRRSIIGVVPEPLRSRDAEVGDAMTVLEWQASQSDVGRKGRNSMAGACQ